jgi:hypothetical protein
MRRISLALLVVLFLSIAARPATAQTGLPGPPIEVGFDGSLIGPGYDSRRTLAPRVSFNLAPDLMLTARGDALVKRQHLSAFWNEARTFDVELRRPLHQAGAFSVDAIVGIGHTWSQYFSPAYSYRVGSQTVTQPGTVRRLDSSLYVLGFGATQRVGGHLSMHQTVEIMFGTEAPGLVAQFGVDAPLGRYVTRRPGQAAHFGAATLRTGQHVWVTEGNGHEVEGAVGDIDQKSIEVVQRDGRTLMDMNQVQRIEIADSPADGARRGALIGGVGAGLIAALAASSLCEGSCGGEGILIVAAAAGYGAGIGGLWGALVDSLHVGRRTIVDRSTPASLAVAPVLGRQRMGARAVIRW